MKFVRCFVLAALLAGFVSVQGCKKDETKEYDSLDGYISLSLPPYVEPGYTKTFTIDTLMHLSREDGGKIGYAFRDSGKGVYDTLVTADGVIRHHDFVFTAPDAIVTNSLSLVGFVDQDAPYYSSTASVSYSVVRAGLDGRGSVTNFNIGSSEQFVDLRDGEKYYAVDRDKLSWMRQNLAWKGAGAPYMQCAAISSVFGRYYTWEEAQTACPEGWRLPTDADWTSLDPSAEAGEDLSGMAGKVMADLYFNGSKMWEYWREVKISDQLGLSVMPVGYATVSGGSYTFDGLYAYAAFWTSDESDGLGVCRYVYHNKDVIFRGRLSKTDFAASVRCVRDLTE